MNYIPQEQSQINFNINWANLLEELHGIDIDGVIEHGQSVLNVFDELEELSRDSAPDGHLVCDCIKSIYSRVELWFDAVSNLAGSRYSGDNPQTKALYTKLSDLLPILEYAPYGAMWAGLSLCEDEKPKDLEIAKMLHGFKTCRHEGAALLKHFRDTCEYLRLLELVSTIDAYRKIEMKARTVSDYQQFLDRVYYPVTGHLLMLTAEGYLEQADLLLGFAVSALSEVVSERKQHYNLLNCERILEEGRTLYSTNNVDIGQHITKKTIASNNDDKKVIAAFWERYGQESQLEVVPVDTTSVGELNTASQVINDLWLRLQDTVSYIELFRSQAQRQEARELNHHLYHVLCNKHMLNRDKAVSIERLLSRFVSDIKMSNHPLHQEVLYLGSSIVGELI